MKKILSMVLVAIMLLTLVGCAADEELAAAMETLEKTQAELSDAKSELENGKSEIEQLKAQLAELEAASGKCQVYALHATIDDQAVVQIDGQTELTAQAVLTEGLVVDHWEINGEAQADATEETFTFTASENTIVEAVLRAQKKLTTVNCKLRFLNEKNEPAGDSYNEFIFEEPYKNPVTEQEITNGTITVQVKAEIPSGYTVDYWKINGIEYHYSTNFRSFVVKELNEATEYEVVLKKAPVYQEPEPEVEEVYYTVTCSGGTIDGKTEVKVKAGTTVTVICNAGYYAEFYINGVQQNSKWDDPYVSKWTFTVNADTHVDCYAIIN